MPLSIEIRSKQVLVVQTVVTKNRIHYKKTCSFDLEEGWVDAKGINDIAAVSFALNKALADSGIVEKKCTICINNPSVIYRELMIPKVEDKRIPFVVRSEMIASLDLNRDHIIDFVILDENTEAHKTHLRVLGIAIAQKALESYIQLCSASNLRPEVVETATTSIIRLVDKSKIAEDGQPIIVADVENDVLKLFLFENKKYILLRTTKLLHLGTDTKDNLIGNVEDDINKMLQFQFTRESRVGVQKIFFFGTNPLLSEIERAVNINLAIDTTMYPKPDFLSGREESYLPYLYPIGAALRK